MKRRTLGIVCFLFFPSFGPHLFAELPGTPPGELDPGPIVRLVSEDFDADGVADLIVGRSGPQGGTLTFHRGNVHAIFPHRPEARAARLAGDLPSSPFLSPERVIEIEVRPDFLVAGDFDRDGHLDIVLAEEGGEVVYLVTGDGALGLSAPRARAMGGRITSLISGEIHRPDGFADLVVALDTEAGATVVILEGPEGAWRAEPEVLNLSSPASALALGQVAGGSLPDLVVAVERELLVYESRDRFSLTGGAAAFGKLEPTPRFAPLPGDLIALALGDFLAGPGLRREVAVLLADGTLRLAVFGADRAEETRKILAEPFLSGTEDPGQSIDRAQLVAIRSPGGATEGLVALDRSAGRLHAIAELVSIDADTVRAKPLESPHRLDRPLALVPMRLSPEAQHDLVLAGSTGIEHVRLGRRAVITVDSVADMALSGDGVCTLREAILNANSNADTTAGDCAAGGGVDSIEFAIGGGGSKATIALITGLPLLDDPVVINGNTQGCDAPPCIVLDGEWTPGSWRGLQLTASGSTIRGLVIQNFDNHGLDINSNGNYVEGCFIGTNADGSAAAYNSRNGVVVNGGSGNTVGGTSAAARNLISGNHWAGVVLWSSGGNLVLGNRIGTDASGTQMLANLEEGVYLGFTDSNLVGGVSSGAGNLISGNGESGIVLATDSTANNLVQGNRIGTDVSGTQALGNGLHGVHIDTFQQTNAIGLPGAGNLISANGGHGILLEGENYFCVIQDNRIGTDVGGTAMLGNAWNGVEIFFEGGGGHLIGGTLSSEGNTIAGNGTGGVSVPSEWPPWMGIAGRVVEVLGNSIYDNNGLGIDLLDDGVTLNDVSDPDDGPNFLNNFPLLASVTATHSLVTIQGSLNSEPNDDYRIEFFANAHCDGSEYGQGERYLGFTTVSADGSGNATFNVNLSTGVGNGEAITAVSTHYDGLSGSSSEFSPCISATCATTWEFGQQIEAQDPNTFRWESRADVRYVKGRLAEVSTYGTVGRGWLQNARTLDVSLDQPQPGTGLYYLMRGLACGSWQTLVGDEPERDAALP